MYLLPVTDHDLSRSQHIAYGVYTEYSVCLESIRPWAELFSQK